jgi:ligand-binding SRPBCC domain-containing protein
VRLHEFRATDTIALPRDRVFAFFSDAANLEVITPPELRFRILTPQPIAMHPRALIRYRLRLIGVPFEWVTRITEWNPPHGFVDEQLAGPYKAWVHRHRFLEVPMGTQVDDDVTYELPLYPFSELAAPVVAFQVRRIFSFRTQAIRRALGV